MSFKPPVRPRKLRREGALLAWVATLLLLSATVLSSLALRFVLLRGGIFEAFTAVVWMKMKAQRKMRLALQSIGDFRARLSRGRSKCTYDAMDLRSTSY